MIKLWLILSAVSLLVGVALYFDQELRLHASWSWEQFLHHESFIAIAGCIGIVLLAVALIENRKT
ncbi:MAG: hypothetical protein JSW16_06875 [Dehalococcoidales bacterium]|nr:MAG: hypothetical protein JSW16_06875 [Dehalococcoidales bacterium]